MEDRARYGKLSGAIGIVANFVLATSKLVVGILTGAVSVIADAVNNYSDAASSIISFIGFRLSARPADDEHPFGHARYEYISGLAVAFLVMVAGVELLKSGVEKIISPSEVTYSPALFIVLLASIAVKLGMWAFNGRLAKKIGSATLQATADDSRNDCITTGALLLSAIPARLFGWHVDGIMSVLVALFILYSGIGLLSSTIKPLLGEAPDPELVEYIGNKIMSYPGVLGTHDLMVHDYGPGRRFASAHVELAAEVDVLEGHELIDQIELSFLEEDHIPMVLHYDPIVTTGDTVSGIRSYLAEQVKSIDPAMSIHDLRIVPGEENTNVVFDCVVPYRVSTPEAELRKIISSLLQKEYPDCKAVIKFDHSYISLEK